jgi:hypothetical protein
LIPAKIDRKLLLYKQPLVLGYKKNEKIDDWLLPIDDWGLILREVEWYPGFFKKMFFFLRPELYDE